MDEEDFGQPGNPDFYVDPKRAKLIVVMDEELHWSESESMRLKGITEPLVAVPARDFGDNNKSDPDQNWDEE